jgi:hypothetical protein
MTPDRWSLPAWVDAVETRRRRPPSSDAARVNGERTRLRRHHTALWLVAIVLSAAIVLPILWKAMAIPDSNPRLLLGTWKTTTAKYRDRSFEIWPTTLVFQTGPGENDFTVHQVDKVDVSVRGDSTLYTLHFLNQGVPDAISLYYAAGPPARVHLQGQPNIVWSRVPRDW